MGLMSWLSGQGFHHEETQYQGTQQQLHDQMGQFTMQMQQQAHDPYMHPGIDFVIDESYHGIDHGMGIANLEHHFPSHDFGNVDHFPAHDFGSHGGFDHFGGF